MSSTSQNSVADRIPTGGQVLMATVQMLRGLEPAFQSNTPEFRAIQSAYLGRGTLLDADEFTSNPKVVQHFQLLIAALLTYHGGIQCVQIQEFTVQAPNVRLFWENNKFASFHIGISDDAFVKLCWDIQSVILKIDRPARMFSKLSLGTIFSTLESYSAQVTLLSRNFAKIVTAIDAPNFSIRQLADELLFIFLSALPVSDINMLFLEIHSSFPPDLEVTLVKGNRVKVGQFLGKTSQDVSFLIDKIKVFATLFYSQSMPVVQEIARGQAAKIVQKLLENPLTREAMQTNLRDTLDLQISPRIEFYQFLIKHLRTLGIRG